MSANYLQALRPRNKSQKDEVDQMRRGAGDGGPSRQGAEGHFELRQLQEGFSLQPPGP